MIGCGVMTVEGAQAWVFGTNIVPHTFRVGTELIAVGIRVGGRVCWDSIPATEIEKDEFGEPSEHVVVPLARVRRMLKSRPKVA